MRKTILLLLLPILLTSCYSGIRVLTDFGRGSSYNADSTQAVFFHFVQVDRPAKGLWSLPDGGMPKVLYKNISLYLLDTETREIERIFDFENLRGNRDSWVTYSAFSDSIIVFNITPVIGWDGELKYPARGIDSVIYQRYKNCFAYHIQQKTISVTHVDTEKSEVFPVPFNELREHTSHLTLMDWGINLDYIYPQTKGQRLRDIAKLKHSNQYRIALIEQMANDLSDKEIDRTIRRMNRYVNSKNDSKRRELLKKRDKTLEWLENVKSDS